MTGSTPDLAIDRQTPTPAGRSRRTQAQRTAETRESLIDAAIHAVYRYGYAGATTAVISDLAGVSRALITHHFGSRAQLMADVVSTVYELEAVAFLAMEADGVRGTRAADFPEMMWEVLSKPASVAVVEIFQATRNDPDLARLVAPLQQQISLRSLDKAHMRFGGIDKAEMLAASRLLVWAIRGLGLAKSLVEDPAELTASVLMLRRLVETAVDAGMIVEHLHPKGPGSDAPPEAMS